MNIRACKEKERKNKIKFKRMSCQRRRRREEVEIKNEKERKNMFFRIAPFKTRGGWTNLLSAVRLLSGVRRDLIRFWSTLIEFFFSLLFKAANFLQFYWVTFYCIIRLQVRRHEWAIFCPRDCLSGLKC